MLLLQSGRGPPHLINFSRDTVPRADFVGFSAHFCRDIARAKA
jgi:hypothetical protein